MSSHYSRSYASGRLGSSYAPRTSTTPPKVSSATPGYSGYASRATRDPSPYSGVSASRSYGTSGDYGAASSLGNTTTERLGLSRRLELARAERAGSSSGLTSNSAYGSSRLPETSMSRYSRPSTLSSSHAEARTESVLPSMNRLTTKRTSVAGSPSKEELAKINVHPKGTCDKCDGPHLTDVCPIFKKARGEGFAENHKDSKAGKGKSIGDVGGDNFVLSSRDTRCIPQPGDGSCLFHSLSYGMGGRVGSARELRREICAFVERNGDLEIADDPLREWIKWDGGGSVSSYARRMAIGGWGGGIEMAAFSQMKRVNVHVFERCSAGYKRISAFNVPGAAKTVRVLYRGACHYDALE